MTTPTPPNDLREQRVSAAREGGEPVSATTVRDADILETARDATTHTLIPGREVDQPVRSTRLHDPVARAAHELRMTTAAQRMTRAIEKGMSADDALAGEPADIQGYMRRHALGSTAVLPVDIDEPELPEAALPAALPSAVPAPADPVPLAPTPAAAPVADAEFDAVYARICEQAGIQHTTAHALSTRTTLMTEIDTLAAYGMPRTTAADYAAAKLGLIGTAESTEAARLQGMRLARTALPAYSTPATLPPMPVRDITMDNIGDITLEDIERIKRERREQV